MWSCAGKDGCTNIEEAANRKCGASTVGGCFAAVSGTYIVGLFVIYMEMDDYSSDSGLASYFKPSAVIAIACSLSFKRVYKFGRIEPLETAYNFLALVRCRPWTSNCRTLLELSSTLEASPSASIIMLTGVLQCNVCSAGTPSPLVLILLKGLVLFGDRFTTMSWHT